MGSNRERSGYLESVTTPSSSIAWAGCLNVDVLDCTGKGTAELCCASVCHSVFYWCSSSSVNDKIPLLYSWGKEHVASFRALLF